MPKSRAQKQEELTTLVDQLRRMKSVVLATTAGVKVADSTALRKLMRAQQAEYVVVKKTLFQKALAETGVAFPMLETIRQGFALAFGIADEVTPAKLIDVFRRDHESVQFLGGIVNGVVYSAEEVRMLARIPSRPELLTTIVGALQAPLSGFVRTLNGPTTGFLRVLQGRADASAA